MKKKSRKVKKPEPISIRDIIQEQYSDIPLLFMTETEYDEAIIGVCDGISVGHSPKVVYDYDLVIKINRDMGMTHEEAIEYFDYNQAGAYLGEHTPVFMTAFKKEAK